MSNSNFLIFIMNIGILLATGAFGCALITITRRAYLFGVRVPEEAHKSRRTKSLKKRYLAIVLISMIIGISISIIQYIFYPNATLVLILYYPFVPIVGHFVAYISCWKGAVELKKKMGWKLTDTTFAQVQSAHTRGSCSDIPWVYYIFSSIVTIIAAIILVVNYDMLPNRIPIHYDFQMNPDRWIDKSVIGVFGLLLIQLGVFILMLGTAIIIMKAKLQISPENPELSFAQHRMYRKGMGHCIGVLTLSLAIMLSYAQILPVLPEATGTTSIVFIILMSISILPVCIFTIYAGQGGGRLKPKKLDALAVGYKRRERIKEANDDEFWKLGMFYCNPNDPAWIVEDRFGSNIGFNYSRKGVKIVVIFLVTALAVTYILATWALSKGIS